MRRAIVIIMVLSALGCASHRATPPAKLPDSSAQPRTAPTTQPILYRRTGGIAGTDDRVVIWPDGFVEVDGKLMTASVSRVMPDRLAHLSEMFRGWQNLQDSYLTSNIPDAYFITIHYGGKTVESSDLAPNLPQQFRQIFTEIESIAAQSAAGAEAKPIDGAP